MQKKLLITKLFAALFLVALFSCQQKQEPLLNCSELGLQNVSPTPSLAFEKLWQAIATNDTVGALALVVNPSEIQNIYPRLIDADPHPTSAKVMAGYFHAENMKHLKRWFREYAGKPLPLPPIGAPDSVVQHRGLQMHARFALPDSLALAQSLVRCQEGYKVWAIMDLKQKTRLGAPL